jgi:hypothetical protein
VTKVFVNTVAHQWLILRNLNFGNKMDSKAPYRSEAQKNTAKQQDKPSALIKTKRLGAGDRMHSFE